LDDRTGVIRGTKVYREADDCRPERHSAADIDAVL